MEFFSQRKRILKVLLWENDSTIQSVFVFIFHRDTKQRVLALLLFLENPNKRIIWLLNDIAHPLFSPIQSDS